MDFRFGLILPVFTRLFPTKKTDPELAPFRSGLVFGFFNALTWQIGIGTPMVLFAERLGATSAQVGLAYGFVFLLTPVQIVSTALLPRYGFKRVMLGGWGTRSLFLMVPMVLAVICLQGNPQGWMVTALIWSVFLFCLFRSIGAAAITPWLYSILPAGTHGRYFANDQFVSALAGTGTLLVCAALFAGLPIFAALLVQYAIALVGSTLSYFSLRQLPDAPRPEAIGLRQVLRDTPRHLFTPSPFRRYLWQAVWFFLISTPIPPFLAYYLKVGARLGSGQIMLFEVLRFSGVITAAWLIRRRIDVTGARPFMLVGYALYAVVAVYWLAFLRTGLGGVAGIYAAYFILGLGATCWTVANLNYLPKVVLTAERPLMVSLHSAVISFLGGCSAITWGWVIKAGDVVNGPSVNGVAFQVFFGFVLVSTCVLSALGARLVEDKTTQVEPLVIGHALLRPFRAATTLISLIDLQKLDRGRSAADEHPKA